MAPSPGARSTSSSANRLRLAVAQANSCEYCLAAHTALGSLAGLQPEEILASRRSSAVDIKRDAALKFAQAVVVNRGDVSDAALSAIRAAGFTDGEITEIVAHVALKFSRTTSISSRGRSWTSRGSSCRSGPLPSSPISQAGRTREFDRPPCREQKMPTIKPPFTAETAPLKVQAAEDAWNSRDPERVALAYSEDSEWRNRTEFFQGRERSRPSSDGNGPVSSTTASRRRCGGFETTAWP